MIIDTPIWSGIGSPWTSMEFSPFVELGKHWVQLTGEGDSGLFLVLFFSFRLLAQ